MSVTNTCVSGRSAWIDGRRDTEATTPQAVPLSLVALVAGRGLRLVLVGCVVRGLSGLLCFSRPTGVSQSASQPTNQATEQTSNAGQVWKLFNLDDMDVETWGSPDGSQVDVETWASLDGSWNAHTHPVSPNRPPPKHGTPVDPQSPQCTTPQRPQSPNPTHPQRAPHYQSCQSDMLLGSPKSSRIYRGGRTIDPKANEFRLTLADFVNGSWFGGPHRAARRREDHYCKQSGDEDHRALHGGPGIPTLPLH